MQGHWLLQKSQREHKGWISKESEVQNGSSARQSAGEEDSCHGKEIRHTLPVKIYNDLS
jgi:hypothetical protein